MGTNRGLRSRSQVSAPIELFVAVIIMSMSIAIAVYIYQKAGNTQCSDQIRSQNERLQIAMQTVAQGFWGTSEPVDYYMDRCGSTPVDAVRFSYFSNVRYCGACPSTFGGCWKIEPLTYNPNTNDLSTIPEASVCITLAEKLTIEGDPTCNVNVTNMACPLNLRGTVVANNTCAGMVKMSDVYGASGTLGSNQFATFGRDDPSASYFKIKITKAESAAGPSGRAGRIVICASQVV